MRVASLWTRSIRADGKHNAFPGIARFGNAYYVTFRRSEGHRNPRAGIAIIRAGADDLDHWTEVAAFDIDGDSRDPFICVVNDRLHVYWHRKPSDWVVTSADGEEWSEPREIESEFPAPPPDCDFDFTSRRKWHFRIRRGPDGYYYSLARCGLASNGNPGILLYRSTDGLSWEATHTFGEGIQRSVRHGHEADLAFMEDGSAVAAIRIGGVLGGATGMIVSAPPPYSKWDGYWTGVRNFGGPSLWPTSQGLMLAARSYSLQGCATCMLWEVTEAGLTSPYIVPSGGDCA